MSNTSYLPPKPDEIGYPLPPRAPVHDEWEHEERPPFEHVTRPKLPEGVSPILEWHAESRRWRIGLAVLWIIGGSAFYTYRFGGLGWMTSWWLWSVLIGVACLSFFGSNPRVFVGSDWISDGRGFAKTYELVSVEVVKSPGWNVVFRDRSGGKVVVSVYVLQANRDLWDFVYNGIRHSVANGAQVNPRARKWIQL